MIELDRERTTFSSLYDAQNQISNSKDHQTTTEGMMLKSNVEIALYLLRGLSIHVLNIHWKWNYKL